MPRPTECHFRRFVARHVDQIGIADARQRALVANGNVPTTRFCNVKGTLSHQRVTARRQQLAVDHDDRIRHGQIGHSRYRHACAGQRGHVTIVIRRDRQAGPLRKIVCERHFGHTGQIGYVDHIAFRIEPACIDVVFHALGNRDEHEPVLILSEPRHGRGLPPVGMFERGMHLHASRNEAARCSLDHHVCTAGYDHVARVDHDTRCGGREQLSRPQPLGGQLPRTVAAGQQEREQPGPDDGQDCGHRDLARSYHLRLRVGIRNRVGLVGQQTEHGRRFTAPRGIPPGLQPPTIGGYARFDLADHRIAIQRPPNEHGQT